MDLGWTQLTSCAQALGAFWASNVEESDGSRRSRQCKDRVTFSKQLVGALFNTGLPFHQPVPYDVDGPNPALTIIEAMQAALAAGDRKAMIRLNELLDAYNQSGDDEAIFDDVVFPHADPNGTKDFMDLTGVDCN